MKANHLQYAWIGLHKQVDNCNAGYGEADFECRSKGWDWLDEAEYTYPSTWQNWDSKEPKPNELCLRLTKDGLWDGFNCRHNLEYLCERGKNVTNYTISFLWTVLSRKLISHTCAFQLPPYPLFPQLNHLHLQQLQH